METTQMKKKKSPKMIYISLVILALMGSLAAGGTVFYENICYSADQTALKAMEAEPATKVYEVDEGWLFDGPGTEKAMIFYPGAFVEAQAYAPLMQDLADQGLDCFLVKMPLKFALLGKDKAQKIIEGDRSDYQQWYMGGHSLGGVAASMFAGKHLDEIDGIALLASYSTVPLHKPGFEAITLYGSEDHVLQVDQMEKNKDNLPENSPVIEIAGGNHAQFGDYGVQKGDGMASISAKEQQSTAAQEILKAFHVTDAQE